MAVSAVRGTLLGADGDLLGRRRQECRGFGLDEEAVPGDGGAAVPWRGEGRGALGHRSEQNVTGTLFPLKAFLSLL